MIKKIGIHTLQYLPATLVPALISLVSVPIYTRLFNPNLYGYYAIATTTIAFLNAIGIGWLSQATIRYYEIGIKKNQLDNYYATILFSLFLFSSFISILALIILYLLKNLLHPILFKLLILSILCFFSLGIDKTLLAILRASQRTIFFTSMEVLTSLSRLGLALFMIFYLKMNILAILIAYLIATMIPVIIMASSIIKKRLLSLSLLSWKLIKELLKYGYPLSFALISLWLLSLANRYLIGFFRGSEEVGYFSVSSSLSEKPLTMVFSVIMLAAYPIIISVWERSGKKTTIQLISQLSRYYFIVCIPLVFILSVLSKEILLVISPDYVKGHIIIPYIASGIFFLGLSQYVGKGFELLKKTDTYAISMISVGIFNIILTVILINTIGFLGAGISTALSYLLLFILLKHKVKNLLPWKINIQSSILIILSAFIMTIVMIIMKKFFIPNILNLSVISVSGLIVYSLFLFIFGEIKKSEWDVLQNLLNIKRK